MPTETLLQIDEIDSEMIDYMMKNGKVNAGELAELVGMSVPFLSQIETAKRKASMKIMVAIAKALRVKVDDLITSG